MFKNLFNRSTRKIYLAGNEVHLNGDQQCQNFIATQITDKITAQSVYHGMELIFENNKLIKAISYENYGEPEASVRALADDEKGMPFFDFPENRILKFIEDTKGLHQLGGNIPEGFSLPENNCVVPFQHLGFINHNTPEYCWLPFTVHLTCPIYLNIGNVFIDYKNPLKPVIINREEVEATDTSYDDDLDRNTEIVFNALPLSTVEEYEFSGSNQGGIPNWIQYPDIPVCPRNGKRMRFLCQLVGGSGVKHSNIYPKDEYYKRYFEDMNFWIDGNLYVFFEPESKTACYFIQNT